jgi:hypothetical protein
MPPEDITNITDDIDDIVLSRSFGGLVQVSSTNSMVLSSATGFLTI